MEYIDYYFFEKQCKLKYSRVCINGDRVKCSICVGYCDYEEHPGFLTEKLRMQHCCLENECDHYFEKPKDNKSAKHKKNKSAKKDLIASSEQIVSRANNLCEEKKEIKFIKAKKIGDLHWELSYITIVKECQISDICKLISDELGCKISLKRLNYEYETCMKLILGFK